MDGVERIARERKRQVEQEGWSMEHDRQHGGAELSLAAACYSIYAAGLMNQMSPSEDLNGVPLIWPWLEAAWKPSDDPIRNLEKAGALIAAEIDRLLRQEGSIT